MSITIKNLETALAGESQAHIKYRYFARIARAEGHEEVALPLHQRLGQRQLAVVPLKVGLLNDPDHHLP